MLIDVVLPVLDVVFLRDDKDHPGLPFSTSRAMSLILRMARKRAQERCRKLVYRPHPSSIALAFSTTRSPRAAAFSLACGFISTPIFPRT